MSRPVLRCLAWSLCALLLGASLLGPAAGCGAPTSAPEEIAVIQVRDFGVIKLRFFPDKAPNHVAKFKERARAGFYDGTTFHRVLPGMLIQGGGDSDQALAAEFNDVPHRRGIVSMARANDPDSARSQFFIMVADHKDWKELLDGQYTVFGEVIEGMDVAERIAWTPKDRRTHRPLTAVVMDSVRIEQRGTDTAG